MFQEEVISLPGHPAVTLRQLDPVRDYDGGFLTLLNKLTEVGVNSVTKEAFIARAQRMSPHRVVLVAFQEDVAKVVGTGSVFIELKFSRDLGAVGHIEDVIVDESVRGTSLGRVLIDRLVRYATEGSARCYKVVLDCKEHNTKFYEKCGFHRAEVCMRIDSKM